MTSNVFIILNIIAVIAAIEASLHEARFGWDQWKLVNWVRVGCASIYLMSYIFLFIATNFGDPANPGDFRIAWSQAMTGIAPFVWISCWWWPARRTRQIRHAIDAEVKRSIEESKDLIEVAA